MTHAFKDHFSKAPAAYAAARPHYPAKLFEYIASLAPSRACAWDVATGSGQAAVELAPYFDHVIATDASEKQLAHAEARPNVEYRVALAESSGLPAASVDAITVAQALHWFDLPRFADEVRRVATPRGAVVVWCYGLNRIGPGLDEVIDDFYEHTVGPYWPPERSHTDDAYARLNLPFARIDTPPFEMRHDWPLERFLGYIRTWSAVQRCAEATGANPVDALERSLAPLWGDVTKRKTIVWPLTVKAWRVE